LYLSANKRLGHGVTINSNYTWSHCISDIYDQQTGSNGASPINRRNGRGNCIGADLRQAFILNMVATSPKFSANRWLHAIAANWQVAPIIEVKSAQFFTIIPGTDRALTTAPVQTGNLVNPDGIYPSNQSVNHWLNTSAFALPALGTYGNLGQNNIKGPGVFQMNMALSRTFRVWGEKRAVQVRAEAFNLINHLNPAAPGANGTTSNSLASSTFGQILTDISGNNGLDAGDPRIIQFAMKFVF
jgi:hypothetical protein